MYLCCSNTPRCQRKPRQYSIAPAAAVVVVVVVVVIVIIVVVVVVVVVVIIIGGVVFWGVWRRGGCGIYVSWNFPSILFSECLRLLDMMDIRASSDTAAKTISQVVPIRNRIFDIQDRIRQVDKEIARIKDHK